MQQVKAQILITHGCGKSKNFFIMKKHDEKHLKIRIFENTVFENSEFFQC